MKQKQQSEAPYRYSPEREKRVATALRENLRKRKQQKEITAENAPIDKIED